MNRFEYWFLDIAIREMIGLSWVVPDEQFGGLAINRAPLELDEDEIIDVLSTLFARGDILALISADIPVFAFHNGIIPSRQQIADGLNQREPVSYFLTSQGGERWEVVSYPKWENYIWATCGHEPMTKCEAICNSLDNLKQYLKQSHLLYSRCYPILNTDVWDILKPWKVTYWKTLPIGYRVQYLANCVELDICWKGGSMGNMTEFENGVERDWRIVAEEKAAREWMNNMQKWYTNYFLETKKS